LALGELAGHELTELTGGVPFDRVESSGYRLTLPSYGFYWFEVIAP
jgi:hypothetical protein